MSEQELREKIARIEALALAGLVNKMPEATLLKIAKIARGDA